MSKFGLLFFVAFILAFASSQSFACVCVGPESPKENLEWADAVFSGKVISAKEGVYTFEVERVWKGVSESQVIVKDFSFGSDCGFNFQLNEQYVIFAYTGKTEKVLTVDPCTWNQRLKNAKKIFRSIGKGKLLADVEKRQSTKSKTK